MKHREIAYIDLTSKSVSTSPISEEVRRLYLGGRGINMYLLYNRLQPGVEPLGPDNILVFGAGMLVGTAAPSSARVNISARSPLSGLLGDSNVGGFWGAALRSAGFDHLVIEGKAALPTYLWLHDGKIEFKDASHLWGHDALETQELLRKELKDPRVQVMCIGQAGENLVRFACVRHGHKNSAGRTGMGAVMGSKNLKAIAVQGGGSIEIAFPHRLLELRQAAYLKCSRRKGFQLLSQYGTPYLVDAHQGLGNLPVRNNQRNQMEEVLWEGLSINSLMKHSLRMKSCFGCFVHCRHSHLIPSGPYKGAYAEGPEYFAINALGIRTGCYDLEVVLSAIDLCNRYGLDTTCTGGIIAWLMELYQRKIVTRETVDGLSLEWGNGPAILALIDKIARREGIGRHLAEGGVRAAEQIGKEKNSAYYFMHVKGLAIEAEERGLKGCALNMATASRGADHLRSRPIPEGMFLPPSALKDIYGRPVSSDPHSYEGKAWMVVCSERWNAISDMTGICRFLTKGFFSPNMLDPEDFTALVNAAAGLEMSPDEIEACGERLINIERLFNLREGLVRGNDTVPERYYQEDSTSFGPLGGARIHRDKFHQMLDEYYELHGWDRQGVPAGETLSESSLDREPGRLL
ncbi:aldehyde ferredoxin oxidoreductase family protein [Chloroflexota bacterium]